MNIAILGASSQIAKDLIVSFATTNHHLNLFARRTDEIRNWLETVALVGRYAVDEFTEFDKYDFDAVINFVGVGDPARIVSIGNSILDITLRFDEMVLNYLKLHPTCRYLFLSSGAAYGSDFERPATHKTKTSFKINELQHNEWYGIAKLHAECRHRAFPDLPIIDIRVFNYFSHTQDINARFLITDILRAIRDKSVLKTDANYIVRDYLHPSDFSQLVIDLLSAPAINTSVDCYSKAPIDKPTLLNAMKNEFGLCYKMEGTSSCVNATSGKPHYYSLNKRAAEFGYEPKLSSLEGVMMGATAMLRGKAAKMEKH